MTESSEYLPEVVYGAEQVAALDRRFIEEFDVDGFELMQRAARAAYEELAHIWAMPGTLCVFCGPGNNGADGLLVADLAREGGWEVHAISLVGTEQYSGDAAKALSRRSLAASFPAAWR